MISSMYRQCDILWEDEEIKVPADYSIITRVSSGNPEKDSKVHTVYGALCPRR